MPILISMPPQADSVHDERRRPLIAVCIPTYRRNDLLRSCLDAAASLACPAGFDVTILVCDNDEGGGARAVVDDLRRRSHYAVHYRVEPRRGLASVRNRLLDDAIALGADWVAFVDDDERPGHGWLVSHLDNLRQRGAQVATGPVLSADRDERPIAPGKRRETGTEPRYVACNNVVFDSRLAVGQRLRFDPRFDFIGGEDFEFFDRSRRLGNRHVWVAEAPVYETIPPDRLTWGYLFKRHFSGAVNSIVRYRKLHSAPRAWIHYTLKAAGKLAGALFCLLAALFVARGDNVRAAWKKLANGTGYFAGLLNIRLERYR